MLNSALKIQKNINTPTKCQNYTKPWCRNQQYMLLFSFKDKERIYLELRYIFEPQKNPSTP